MRAVPVVVGLALLLAAAPLQGQQDTARAEHPDSAAPAGAGVVRPPVDSAVRPPVTPMGAFWRSLLLPGWGQAALGRKLTGGIMVAWEGVALGMTIKTSHELAYFQNTHSSLVPAKEQEQQDWIVLLAFNHLFSALEAYVSAHLWDFPPDLRIQALPHGVGAAVSIPLPHP